LCSRGLLLLLLLLLLSLCSLLLLLLQLQILKVLSSELVHALGLVLSGMLLVLVVLREVFL